MLREELSREELFGEELTREELVREELTVGIILTKKLEGFLLIVSKT
jgi:hypothetical protein